MMLRRTVFLDRDGTINVDHGYVCRREDWQFLDGALDALRALQTGGYALAVVTNQSGIARGNYSVAEVQALHEHMKGEAGRAGVSIDAIAYCPHGPGTGCSCRKPGTRMSRQIEEQLGCPIDYRHSWTVGDKPSDIGFGESLGTRTVLLTSPYWSDAELAQRPNWIVDSLREGAARILGGEPQDLLRGDERR